MHKIKLYLNEKQNKKIHRQLLYCMCCNNWQPLHPLHTRSLPDGKVVRKLPSQVAICQDSVIRDVIGGDELERHLSLSYLHPDVAKAPPTSLLAHLGVRYLRGSDVSTVTTAMAKELVRAEGIHSGVWSHRESPGHRNLGVFERWK